jgi:hypothetical protein
LATSQNPPTKKTVGYNVCFWSIFLCSHSGNYSQEDLAKFEKLEAKYESKIFKHTCTIFGYIFEPPIETNLTIFLKFWFNFGY